MGEEILRGLQACPKVFPEWYQYDKEGSRLFQKNKLESQFYYFNPSETSNLTTRVNDIVSCIEQPCDVVDLGNGYMKNTRLLIDCLLKKQDSLNLYPIDKSTDTLQEESKRIAAEYGDRLIVLPIPGDYSVGLDAIRNNGKTRKIIVMLGGSIQNIPYDEQTSFLKNVVNAMTDKDIFVMTVDINTDGDAILKAYLGGDLKSGGTEMYRNVFTRFNKEFGTTIDPSTFDIDGTFKRNFGSDRPSQLEINAISKIDQMHTIQAVATCSELGAWLVDVQNAEEMQFLFERLGKQWFWIRALDQQHEGIWTLVSGGSLQYTNWWPGEPNDGGGVEDCALSGDGCGSKWNDALCSDKLYFICKKDYYWY